MNENEKLETLMKTWQIKKILKYFKEKTGDIDPVYALTKKELYAYEEACFLNGDFKEATRVANHILSLDSDKQMNDYVNHKVDTLRYMIYKTPYDLLFDETVKLVQADADLTEKVRTKLYLFFEGDITSSYMIDGLSTYTIDILNDTSHKKYTVDTARKLANIYYREGDFGKGLSTITDALKERFVMKDNKAVLPLKTGDDLKALGTLAEGYRLNGHYDDAKEAYMRLYKKAKDHGVKIWVGNAILGELSLLTMKDAKTVNIPDKMIEELIEAFNFKDPDNKNIWGLINLYIIKELLKLKGYKSDLLEEIYKDEDMEFVALMYDYKYEHRIINKVLFKESFIYPLRFI